MKKLNCVLLVDDNPGDNYLNSYIISQTENCDTVKAVSSSREALSYLTKVNHPDPANLKPEIIFLDINMPGMNGFEFLQEFEKLEKKITEGTSIFMLTSSTDPVEMHRAMSYEFVKGFLAKPLQIESWIQILDKMTSALSDLCDVSETKIIVQKSI